MDTFPNSSSWRWKRARHELSHTGQHSELAQLNHFGMAIEFGDGIVVGVRGRRHPGEMSSSNT